MYFHGIIRVFKGTEWRNLLFLRKYVVFDVARDDKPVICLRIIGFGYHFRAYDCEHEQGDYLTNDPPRLFIR